MCDTFAATGKATRDGAVIFGKNSDREANEAQALEFHPERRHPPGARLRCTYLEIPQAPVTRAVLICRPFWMWGAEMGVNAAGLAVGNEAVWTRMPLNRDGVLTGMDLVRLALERADSAEEGVAVIAGLLHDHGQGGRCGFRDRRMAYHNSFMLADRRTVWVLETAGPYWAAKEIQGVYAISNGLTLGADFDLGHPELLRLHPRKGAGHFARRFADRLYTGLSASGPRRRRAMAELSDRTGRIDVPAAVRLLQDHGGEDDYRPERHWLGDRICAHAANGLTRNATQTTGSLVAHLHPECVTVWVTGTAAPCTSVFKPVWFAGQVLPDLGPAPGERFDPAVLWWSHERLHRGLLETPQGLAACRGSRRVLQEALFEAAIPVAGRASGDVTAEAFRRARVWTEAQLEELPEGTMTGAGVSRRIYRRYWRERNRQAGLPARRDPSSAPESASFRAACGAHERDRG